MEDAFFKTADRSFGFRFHGNPLDRASDRREDADFIAGLRARPDARALLIARDMPILAKGEPPDPLFPVATIAALGGARLEVLLGLEPSGAPVFAALLTLAGCGIERKSSLPVYYDVGEFQLIAQDGRPFDSQVLAGKIWVADFIYTNCPGPCPRMTSQMHEVQDATLNMPEVKLVLSKPAESPVDLRTNSPMILAPRAGLEPAAYCLGGKPEPGQTTPNGALHGADLRRQSPDAA